MYNWYADHYNQIPVVQILLYKNKKRGNYYFPWKKYYSLWSGFDSRYKPKMSLIANLHRIVVHILVIIITK